MDCRRFREDTCNGTACPKAAYCTIINTADAEEREAMEKETQK